ncbi:hypothetical protein N7492_002024 [Penicillium capsulatum]|uniref:Uncharacterized protein n=1 Tax=Penicillium capsulatum TaxID=69766 RepID=A0A9W9IH24_9EURO|nr:hypothetical protein N7492_002024 [Penicillium capsulatum]KAJ6123357.1 hypothetical protein N7512_005822 [Penicillium capsulatum]
MWWQTAAEVEEAVSYLEDKLCLPELVNYTFTHRSRLVRPVVSYDATALALSFLPAAGEESNAKDSTDDNYTYHHLRRDLCESISLCDRQFGSRYTVPSAHVTIARWALPPGLDREAELNTISQRAPRIVDQIESINRELQSDDWHRFGDPHQGEWWVGQETGLQLNKGRTWYGRDCSVYSGQGFNP